MEFTIKKMEDKIIELGNACKREGEKDLPTHPTADVQDCPDLAGLQGHKLRHVCDVALHTSGERCSTSREDQPVALHLHPILFLLRDCQLCGRNIGEPDAVPALRPSDGRAVALRPRHAAAPPLLRPRAMALSMEELLRVEPALPLGVLAGAVIGGVAFAELDRGEGEELQGGGRGVASLKVERRSTGGGRGGDFASEVGLVDAIIGQIGDGVLEEGPRVQVHAEEVRKDAEDGEQKDPR